MFHFGRLSAFLFASFHFMTLQAINPPENGPATKGIITLDSITFNKTISAFPHSFVSFGLSSFTQSLYKLSEEQIKKVGIRIISNVVFRDFDVQLKRAKILLILLYIIVYRIQSLTS